jgi:hypothetical protein
MYKYNEVNGSIKWTNGSLILLKDLAYQPSDPNFDSLGSLEITGAFVDEIAEISYKAIEVLVSRCRYKLKQFGICKKVFMSCNPSKNWSYTQFYLADKDNKLEPYRKFIQALPTDNPHIDPSYIKSLQRLSNALRARLLYGQWEYGEEDVLFEPETFDCYGAKAFNYRSDVADDLKNRSLPINTSKSRDKTLPILNLYISSKFF